MLNERKDPRFDSVIYLKVRSRETGELIGHLVNISDQGLMIVGEQPLEPEQQLQLEIDPPEHLRLSRPVSFEAEIRWCRPDANPDLYDYGLVVTHTGEAFRELFHRLATGFSFSAHG